MYGSVCGLVWMCSQKTAFGLDLVHNAQVLVIRSKQR